MDKNIIAFKYDKQMEKKVENFAVKTINKVEVKSKLLSTSITQLSKVSNMRKRNRRKYRQTRKKI